MKGMMGGMAGLMKQANQMQMKMKKMQEELATREFSGTSGGGAVTAKVNGDISTGKLVVEIGASFTGNCSMGSVIKDIKHVERNTEKLVEKTA